jgi:hypothetical protein
MRSVLPGVALAAALIGPGAAAAQAPDGGTALEVRSASASLTATFRSDARTCRAVGRCGLRGRVVFRGDGPALGGGFSGIVDGSAVGGGGWYQRSAATTATVHDRGQTCRDRIAHRVTAFAARQDAAQLRVTFFAPAAAFGEDAEGAEDPLSTRCAGPRLPDLGAAKALPVASLPLSEVRGDDVRIASDGRRSFVAEGLRVTVAWDVALVVSAHAAPVG